MINFDTQQFVLEPHSYSKERLNESIFFSSICVSLQDKQLIFKKMSGIEHEHRVKISKINFINID